MPSFITRLSALFKPALRWLFIIAAIFLLLVALAAAYVRFVVYPNINQYKQKMALEASKSLGQTVQIGEIITGWQGVSPHVVLKQVNLLDAQQKPALQLTEVEATLSWLSLPTLQPKLSQLHIRAPILHITRKPNGDIFVAGIAMSGPAKPEFANWALKQGEIRVSNAQIIWQDELRQAPPLALNKLNATLRSPVLQSLLGQHTLEASFVPSVGTSQAVQVKSRFFGRDISQLALWHGDLSVRTKEADLTAFKAWLDNPIALDQGQGDAHLSLSFAKNSVQMLEADVNLRHLQANISGQSAPFLADSLAGKLSWDSSQATRALKLHQLSLKTPDGLHIEGAQGSLNQQKNGDVSDVTFAVKALDLHALQLLVNANFIPANARDYLSNLHPQGTLENLDFAWHQSAQGVQKYQLNTTLNNTSWQAYNKVPGIVNLSGNLSANQAGGKLTLNSKKVSLDLKDIMRWPIPAEELRGDITWQMNDNKPIINAQEIYFTSPHITGTLNARYEMNGIKGGLIDLSGKFNNGNAKFAPFYYPIVLGKSTLHWLDTSILKGRANDVALTVKGHLADFPFVTADNKLDPQLGVFRVSAKISEAELEYGTGWPTIQGLDLDMLFEGKRMELNSTRGHIFRNQILHSKTSIAKLDADDPILSIISEVQGPVEDGIRFVNESAVKQVTLGFTDTLKTTGAGHLNLELKIPMQRLEAAKYKGAYKLSNATIFANEAAGLPQISKINGTLSFTESGLSTQKASAEAFGQATQFSLKAGTDKIIHVSANGHMTAAGLQQLMPENPIAQKLQGGTDWVGELAIKKPLVDLTVRSNLQGLSMQLPAPLNKTADTPMPFSFSKKQTSETQDTLQIALGNLMSAYIERQQQQNNFAIMRGDIGVNMPAQKPTEAGLSLHGKLDTLNADDWIDAFKTADNLAGAKPKSELLAIKKADVSIKQLSIYGRHLNQLRVQAAPTNTGLNMQINSAELTGDVNWQTAGNSKIIARLSQLTIPDAYSKADASNADKPQTEKKEVRRQEAAYPALDVTAENFQLGDKKLGALTLNAYPNNDDWIIQKLKIINPETTLEGEGAWHNWVRHPNTKFKFTMDVSNIGRALKRFGHPDTVKGGTVKLAGELQWPGSPQEFRTDSLDGNFSLEAGKGQIVKVQPGVGRLLGLLSLQSLPRRLSLDFRDLFSEGFAFDKVSATAKLDNGIMRSDDFVMDGPAAQVNIKGETNLQKETQNLNVKVVPHVTDSVSLAAFAGGPIAGVAAFVAQKLLKDPLNKIASAEYTITGTWDNPQELKPNAANEPNNLKKP